MTKKMLSEQQRQIISEAADANLREQLTEGFQSGKYMTTDEFHAKLESLKTSLIKKHKMANGNDNS